MKSVSEILEYIDEKISSEELHMKQLLELKVPQNNLEYSMLVGAKAIVLGSRDTLVSLREWIHENDTQ